MNNGHYLGISLALLLIFAGLLCIGVSVYSVLRSRQVLNKPGRCRGQVIGLMRTSRWTTQTEGEVPHYALTSYGGRAASQGLHFLPWFPCVRYTVGDKTYTRIVGDGSLHNTWRIGQSVRLRYDPETPVVCAIEGDPSPGTVLRLGLLAGVALAAVGAACLMVLAMLG